MNSFNYQKICFSLISKLGKREKEVLLRRFGLKENKKQTLELIGQDFGVCRERIRQIQKAGFKKIEPETEKYKKLFSFFSKHIKKFGGVRREDALLEELGGEKGKNEVKFLLSLKDVFKRINKNDDFHSLWMSDKTSYNTALKVINTACGQLKKENKPLTLKELKLNTSLGNDALCSYLDVSKKVQRNQAGFYGFSNWPEINPKGIRDKAYIAVKKTGKPLHFSQVADLISGSHIQTVHNELIKDKRFVLVGRGIYALSEWGYYHGQVKDVIFNVLQEAEEPLTKNQVLEKVLKQRLVRKNTILLNLSDEGRFLKNSDGRYKIKEI